jgi:hypothetical protein
MSNQPEEQELTQEELVARKEEMKAFYDDSIPYLKSQAEYEKLLTEIDEARFKRSTLNYQWAQFIAKTSQEAQYNEEGEDESETERVLEQEETPVTERKLKRS